jgi:hypothetical protein
MRRNELSLPGCLFAGRLVGRKEIALSAREGQGQDGDEHDSVSRPFHAKTS